MTEQTRARRLGVFVFYDKAGRVDDYVPYLLEDLTQNLTDLVIVCNGRLDDAGRAVLSRYSARIVVRENKGLDFGAYRDALVTLIGFDKLAEYDELVLFNDTFFGPLYPFSEVFGEMAPRPVDFWGLTCHYETHDTTGRCRYDCLPTHIQSYFLVVRSRMLKSAEFKTYWEQLKTFDDFKKTVASNEVIFTRYFSDLGFTWDVLVDTSDMASPNKLNFNPYAALHRDMIENRRMPVIKRKIFSTNKLDVLVMSGGGDARACYEYVKKSGRYDTRLIWQNVLRLYNIRSIYEAMNFNFVLPGRAVCAAQKKDRKVALFMHCYYPDLIGYCASFAASMPPYADIYVTTNTEEKAAAVRAAFSKIPCAALDVRVVENRGREIAAFLADRAEEALRYDLICFIHDKKSPQMHAKIVGWDFCDQMFVNALATPQYVENILTKFDEEPRLGMLGVPAPIHAEYIATFGREWTTNFDVAQKYCAQHGFALNLSAELPPFILGTTFWCRPKALAALLDRPWTHADFPDEPLPADQSINHVVERILPYVAQEAGYFSGIALCDAFAEQYLTALLYDLRDIRTTAKLMRDPLFYEKTSVRLKNKLYNIYLDIAPKFVKDLYRRIKYGY